MPKFRLGNAEIIEAEAVQIVCKLAWLSQFGDRCRRGGFRFAKVPPHGVECGSFDKVPGEQGEYSGDTDHDQI